MLGKRGWRTQLGAARHPGAARAGYEPDERRYEHNCYFYTSADDGRTWTIRGTIQEGDINETAPVLLPTGELLACARTLGDQHLELFRSLDHGRTWQREQTVSGGSQHPGHLLSLGEGRVLLTYGDRREGYHGIEVRLSENGGHTWSEPARLVDLEPADLGYPATVSGDADTLVTAWYTAGIAAHQRYHMGAAVWTLAERFPLEMEL
jgi:hypothetical protein